MQNNISYDTIKKDLDAFTSLFNLLKASNEILEKVTNKILEHDVYSPIQVRLYRNKSSEINEAIYYYRGKEFFRYFDDTDGLDDFDQSNYAMHYNNNRLEFSFSSTGTMFSLLKDLNLAISDGDFYPILSSTELTEEMFFQLQCTYPDEVVVSTFWISHLCSFGCNGVYEFNSLKQIDAQHILKIVQGVLYDKTRRVQ